MASLLSKNVKKISKLEGDQDFGWSGGEFQENVICEGFENNKSTFMHKGKKCDNPNKKSHENITNNYGYSHSL